MAFAAPGQCMQGSCSGQMSSVNPACLLCKEILFMCGQRWANLYAVNPWNGNDSVIMSCPAMLVDFAAEVSEPINWIMQGYL